MYFMIVSIVVLYFLAIPLKVSPDFTIYVMEGQLVTAFEGESGAGVDGAGLFVEEGIYNIWFI